MATGYYRIYSYELKLTTDKVTTIQVKAEGDITGLYPMLIYSIGDSEYNLCDATLVGLATGSTDVYEYEWTPPTTEIAGYIPSSESSTITFGVNTHRRGESAVVKTLKNYTGASITVNQSLKPTIDVGLTKTHDFLSESVSKITDHNITIELSCLFGASQDIEIRTDGNFNFGAHVPAFYTKTKKISAALGRFDSGDADSKKIEVDIIVTDSRGRRSSKSLFITVYKYNPPEITTAIVTRNENEQPSLEFACKYQSSVAGSTNNLKFFYIRCLNDDPDYNTDLIGKASPQELAGTYDITKTYKFEVCVKDSVAIVTTYKELVLPSEKLAMDIGADGKTVTFFGTSPSSSDKEALRIGDFANFAADKSELMKEFYLNNQFILRSQNGIFGYKPSTGEKVLAFEPQSGAGNTTIGWGNYNLGKGSTNIYSGENMAFVGKKDILFTAGGVYRGRYSGATRVLASPSAFMNANQTANLSEKVSEQLFGIVLCFSLYYNNAVSGQFTFHFVPKTVVAQESRFYAFPMTTSKYWYMGTRYLKITDTQIIGSNENTGDGISTASGTVNQSKFVLYKVYGV